MMSKKILIILLLPIWVFAQNDTIKSNNNWTNSEVSFENKRIKKTRPILAKKDNIIKTSVLPYAWGEVNLSFEKKMSNRTSLRIGAATALYDALLKLPDSTQLSTFFISSDFRIYLGWKKANRGFYIAPHIQHRVMSYKSTTTKEIIQYTGAGLLFGNQWIANSFVYDLNVGLTTIQEISDARENTYIIVLPNLTFLIGYAF
tara:strand:- start:48 stop:653 length:606 start_codon:yes stop_codon:yes gene_type:complete